MMPERSQYVCQQCGYSQVGWAGKCPNCGTWGALVETITEGKGQGRKGVKGKGKDAAKAVSLASVPKKSTSRVSTKISELDRVLGGGLVSGQVVLIAGEPGIGKSTLLLQVANQLSVTSKKLSVLYVSGEESASQIAIRAARLGVKNKSIQLLEETDVDFVINQLLTLNHQPSAVIIDSIQTMSTQDLSGMAGSVGQVRESTHRLVRLAKSKNIPVFIVGHVTKEGTVAGPAVLAHIVDTVLWFEGEKTLSYRLLRAVKNRFGPTDEVGIFEMQDKGLAPVGDAEKIFLTKGKKEVAGSVITSVMQGTRPLLVEVQGLVVPSKLAFPKRVGQGVDGRRLELLLAVLIRRCGLPLYEYDVFVNVAGGIRLSEPAADLAICLSIASSFFDKPIPKKVLALGEVGLLGEIREVVAEGRRVNEAKRLGFTVPITHKEARYLGEAIKKYLR